MFFFACLCAVPMAQGAAELLLNNGRVLRGTDLERQARFPTRPAARQGC